MYRTGRILGNTMVAKRAYPQSFPVGQETQWEAVAFLAVFWKKMLFDDKVVAGGYLHHTFHQTFHCNQSNLLFHLSDGPSSYN